MSLGLGIFPQSNYCCPTVDLSISLSLYSGSSVNLNAELWYLAMLPHSIVQVSLEREVLMQGFHRSCAHTLNRKVDGMKTVLN